MNLGCLFNYIYIMRYRYIYVLVGELIFGVVCWVYVSIGTNDDGIFVVGVFCDYIWYLYLTVTCLCMCENNIVILCDV